MLNLLELEYQKDSSEYFKYFRHMPMATFLDSCATDYKGDNGRYDIITAHPSDIVSVSAEGDIIWRQCLKETQCELNGSPFEVLSTLLASISSVKDERFPFTGGVLGYWSYDLCALLEPERIQLRESTYRSPLMCTGLFWWALITDHQLQTSTLVFHPDIEDSLRTLIINALESTGTEQKSFKLTDRFVPTIDRRQYQDAFERIQDYILAGDCYEVNLTQEFTASYSGDSWEAYKHLRQVSPAPYSAFLSYPGIKILSHSPERFIQMNGQRVETHPIKGTIARGQTLEEDRMNAKLLQSSQKDRSENLMIVDLLRNDLGKVCETGSIKVPRLFALESYANVHHLVSSVTGQLSANTDVFELLSSIFPGGSITGAPKIRSMEIIRELEVASRSVYCGAIGYASCNGRMDTSIAIRTLVDDGKALHCWGGGAIVADSRLEQEYEESVTKVRNLMDALDVYQVNPVIS